MESLMLEISEWIKVNFDWYFVIMILLGNYFMFSLIPYPESITKFKRSKVYLTVVQSVVIGLIYYKIDPTVHIKILINSFLLSTSIYEMGLKDLFDYFKDNGSTILLKKVKEKVEEKKE